jgi:hypothetical protein
MYRAVETIVTTPTLPQIWWIYSWIVLEEILPVSIVLRGEIKEYTKDSCHPLEANPNVYFRGRECCISNNGNTLCGSWSAGPHSRQTSYVCSNIRMMFQLRKYEPQYSWQLGISVKTTLEHFAVARIPLKWHSGTQNLSVSHIFTLHYQLLCCRKRKHANSNYGFFPDRHSRSVLCRIRISRSPGLYDEKALLISVSYKNYWLILNKEF